jgi:hypothetical protein
MISLILSRIFLVAFWGSVIAGIADSMIQVRQKPFTIYRSKQGDITIGKPGVEINARKYRVNEKVAPDTSIIYNIKHAPDYKTSTRGRTSWGNGGSTNTKLVLDSMYNVWLLKKDSIIMDTEIYVIKNRYLNRSYQFEKPIVTTTEQLTDGRVVARVSVTDEHGNSTGKIKTDTFADRRYANIFAYTNKPHAEYQFTEELFEKEKIRVLPVKTTHRIFYVIYNFFLYLFGAWLFLTLSRLFYNFSENDFFTMRNIKLLRHAGWSILVPQCLHFIFFWTLLYRINPVKLFLKGSSEVKVITNYNPVFELDLVLVFLGAGILILSYIFRNGLLLKKENEAFV